MNEFDESSLESELRQWRPKAAGEAVKVRIATTLGGDFATPAPGDSSNLHHDVRRARPVADRVLLGVLTVATAASVVIATLLTFDFAARGSQPRNTFVASSEDRARIAESRQMLAQLADGGEQTSAIHP